MALTAICIAANRPRQARSTPASSAGSRWRFQDRVGALPITLAAMNSWLGTAAFDIAASRPGQDAIRTICERLDVHGRPIGITQSSFLELLLSNTEDRPDRSVVGTGAYVDRW